MKFPALLTAALLATSATAAVLPHFASSQPHKTVNVEEDAGNALSPTPTSTALKPRSTLCKVLCFLLTPTCLACDGYLRPYPDKDHNGVPDNEDKKRVQEEIKAKQAEFDANGGQEMIKEEEEKEKHRYVWIGGWPGPKPPKDYHPHHDQQ